MFKNFNSLPLSLKLLTFYNVLYLFNLVFENVLKQQIYILSFCISIFFFINYLSTPRFRLPVYWVLLFTVISILWYKGIYVGNFSSYLYFDLMSFSAFFLIFITLSQKNAFSFFTHDLVNFAYIINIISLIFCAIYLLKFGLTFGSIEQGRGVLVEDSTILSPKELLYNSLFFYPLISYCKSNRKLFVFHFSLGLFIIFSLAMASRGTSVIAIFVLFISLMHKKRVPISFKIFVNLKFWKIVILTIVVIIGSLQIPKVADSLDLLILRFTESDTSISAERDDEASEVLNGLSNSQFYFGKGLGGANTYWIFEFKANGVNNVHYGWLYLIMKGGVFFLIFIYTYIIFVLVSLFKNQTLRPYAISLAAFVLLEFTHTSFNSYYRLIYLTLSLSAFFIYRQLRKPNIY